MKIVYEMGETGKLARDFETRGQIKRAALSSMNNIAEGFGRKSTRDKIRFLEIAQSSAMEVKSITYVLLDSKYLPADSIETIKRKAEETKALTLGFIRYLRSKKD